jgi:hypothetical protein
VAVELTDKIEMTLGGISIRTTNRAKRSEFLQLPLWPAMTKRSGSHDRGDGDGTACRPSREPGRTCCRALTWRS